MPDYKVVNATQLDSDMESLADSIRAKAGVAEKLAFPAGMKAAVEGILTGSDPVIQPLSVNANGTYTAPEGVDGYSPVTVNVPSSGGGSLIATGSFKPSGSYPNVKITHKLGVVPNFAICYRSAKSTVSAREYGIVVVSKFQKNGTCLAKKGSSLVGGQDSVYDITDTPADYAPFVGAYGATAQDIYFGFVYDSSRGDTYYCFESGWDTFNWIVGVI